MPSRPAAALRAVRRTVAGAGRAAAPNAVRGTVSSLAVLARAGVLQPSRPDRLISAAAALRRWGLGVPGGFAAAAARSPLRVAVIDERGSLTYADMDRRSDAIAVGLRTLGIDDRRRVGILCRNHRGFLEALLAVTKVGADALLLNTGFAAPQLREVLDRERVDLVLHDAEFARLFRGGLPRDRRVIAWSDSERAAGLSLERLASEGDGQRPPVPGTASRLTILTSGTTGAPKGAARSQPRSVESLAGILSVIPLRSGETTLIAAPLFHAWGLANLGLAILLRSTVVLQRRFEPEATLAAVEQHRADALVAVPLMLRRILELPGRVRNRYDTSSLRAVAVSGSALPPDLATEFMDAFGDILYNLYGSTEVAVATIATPDDLRRAPGTTGRPPLGTRLRIADDSGNDVPPGDTGRILVCNDLLFEGYTEGDDTQRDGGFLATGDLGYLDPDGRLFVAGRSDDMIVSGGENVFPVEVEDLLTAHPGIADAAVVGVEDEEWGQRLAAYVVRRGRTRLNEADVKNHVRSRLARYKVPRDIIFVEQIPRSSTGKVQKRELRSD